MSNDLCAASSFDHKRTMPTATEQLVTSILTTVLKQPAHPVEPTDSFADLGLDSLSGIRLVGAIEANMSVELDPMIVLDFPSIASLSARIDELAPDGCALSGAVERAGL